MNYIISKNFNIEISKLELEFKLYTKEYIMETLKNIKMDYKLISVDKYRQIKKRRELYLNDKGEKYHFFSFIRFFECEGIDYGIVGGKTNYPKPDIFIKDNKKEEKRFARIFLKTKNYKWSEEILIVNHSENLPLKEDESQSLFIECFLQRRFNLFDS